MEANCPTIVSVPTGLKRFQEAKEFTVENAKRVFFELLVRRLLQMV